MQAACIDVLGAAVTGALAILHARSQLPGAPAAVRGFEASVLSPLTDLCAGRSTPSTGGGYGGGALHAGLQSRWGAL